LGNRPLGFHVRTLDHNWKWLLASASFDLISSAPQFVRQGVQRIYRLYVDEGLMVRTKQRKQVAVPGTIRPGQCWSMDFVSDKLADGRAFRILTVVDQFTRECVRREADRSMSGAKVGEALQRAIEESGAAPESITCDNGSEFAGRVLEGWAIQQGVQLIFIRPGRPAENGSLQRNQRCYLVQRLFVVAPSGLAQHNAIYTGKLMFRAVGELD